MEDQPISLNSPFDVCLKVSPTTHSGVKTDPEAFLNYDSNFGLSFEDKSTLYNSLVALVKAEYHFGNALQGRAHLFLSDLASRWGNLDYAPKLVTDLVPSSAGSPSGFVESIVTLLSSPHSTVVKATLWFVRFAMQYSPEEIRCLLAESDLVIKVLATLQPHTLPMAGNEEIFDHLLCLIEHCIRLALPSDPRTIDITTAGKQSIHRELIFQNVVLPSSELLTFLISNRYILNGDLFLTFLCMLTTLLRICPFHRPTLEFVLASPVAMAFSSCLSFAEECRDLWRILSYFNSSLDEWRNHGPEVIQSGKRMTRALISEGFEDTLEQMMKYDMDGEYGNVVARYCHSISQLLGSNVPRRR
ncbi:hypothetical protein BLNAU_3449 [Blattamonas nauphoetae]|uniref:Uncharacterized protein n=1 Tax=Blattamonas nauphoetae TaxID=2049346 RepID=A0ABQ9YD08_9EUKA|nr:hypothetical protein BLNAU_3449 [Blattamonas nauphoetae]